MEYMDTIIPLLPLAMEDMTAMHLAMQDVDTITPPLAMEDMTAMHLTMQDVDTITPPSPWKTWPQ